MKEKKARVEDALHATRAAVEEGIVPGGGVALLRSIPSLDKVKVDDEQKVGVDIMRRALEEPIRQIVRNAGVESSIVVQNVREKKGDNGYDARNDEYVKMFDAGIIDPAKVAVWLLKMPLLLLEWFLQQRLQLQKYQRMRKCLQCQIQEWVVWVVWVV